MMTGKIDIRDATSTDLETVRRIYSVAFPDEDLVPLVESLSADECAHGFVAEAEGRVVGHVALTRCGLDGEAHEVALLGPLAADPAFVKQGIGSQLVQHGIDAMRARGLAAVLVLGDPAYYGRFGFAPERQIKTPYPLPAEWADAWQSVWLTAVRLTAPATLVVPTPWRDEALWR